MKNTNEMEIRFDSVSVNEGFARVAVAAFLTQLNPTVEEVSDVKTAVSEAVTNAIIHGYENQVHTVRIKCIINMEEKVWSLQFRMTGQESQMWQRRWSRCLRRSRNWNVPEWDLHLWRHLWMSFQWNRRKAKALR